MLPPIFYVSAPIFTSFVRHLCSYPENKMANMANMANKRRKLGYTDV